VSWSVGQVAELAGVTVRTLHHYDRTGLVSPSRRTASGYRSYEEQDLQRLRHVLFYRELGFGLDQILVLLDDPAADLATHLSRQRDLLVEQADRLHRMIAAVEKELEAESMGTELTAQEKFEVFGADYHPEYEAEAEQRWGDTEAWRQSRDRTSRFTKQDWQGVKARTDELNERLGRAVASGLAPDSPDAMDLAQEHRASIEEFYDCSFDMHRNLADMYLADERFTATYEAVAPGLTRWLHDAIHANADRHAPGA
jgi:DNA-binding transcriptional MerR regulator